ncbi:MAG: carboxypeptidase regulatory-like domain-containing protein [Candidatus Moranbacteria bacterium]|nr:carboxypeptidase regulatory-like domain-containing protein [Candidatus Moranbacteria bacterium]
MNRTQRKLFALLFVLLFALIAPTVVLFAQGYRFSLKNNIFIYSGSITVKSWPRDIEIYINDKKQNKNLNIINGAYTINGVKPGKYKLACSRPGYDTWEKEIEVHSGISTEFWNVLLFPEKDQQNITAHTTSEKIQQFFLSPSDNHELVIFSEKDPKKQIYLLNTENNKTKLIFETKDFDFFPKKDGLNIEWSADNEKIILPVVNKEGQKKYLIIDLNQPDNNFIILNDFFEEENLQQVRWMFNEKNDIALLTKKNNLFSFDHKNKKAQLIAENVSGFDFAEYSIYYSQLPNNIIWRVKQSNFENKKQVTNEPFLTSNDQKFIKITAYDEYRIFMNADNESFLHNENNKKNIISTLRPSKKISEIQFSDDGKKLLCWNKHEAWYYMLRDWEIQPKRYFGDNIVITRSSELIQNIQWMDNYENIILSTNQDVKSFEVDPRNHTNISNLATSKKPLQEKDLIYNKNNQTLYFLDEGQIYSLILIDDTGFLNF